MENRDTLLKNLETRGFTPHHFATGAEAADFVLSQLSDTTVGIGGSVTVQQLELYDRLCEHNTVYWHWKNKDPQTRTLANASDAYICSVNGLSESGEMVNIDGTGNRVAATLCGPQRVFLIVGKNKIAPDLQSAVDRARNVASPLNARRLNTKTPCTVGDVKCHDCKSPERICNAMVTTMRKPGALKECHVIIVEEDLGY